MEKISKLVALFVMVLTVAGLSACGKKELPAQDTVTEEDIATEDGALIYDEVPDTTEIVEEIQEDGVLEEELSDENLEEGTSDTYEDPNLEFFNTVPADDIEGRKAQENCPHENITKNPLHVTSPDGEEIEIGYVTTCDDCGEALEFYYDYEKYFEIFPME